MTWNRFLFVALPVAVAAVAALAEAGAWALDGVAPRRHDLDRLAAALDHAKLDAPLVLLGDSVTQDVAKSYRLAPPGVVANLTTNQASGVVGAALLLRRYLAGNAAPAHVVIAATPEFYAYEPAGAAARTYVSSVFVRDAERAVLRELGIGAAEQWRPAALSLEHRLADPLMGLAAARAEDIPAGDADPAAPPPEAPPVLPGVAEQIARRTLQPLALVPSVRWALADICTQSARHGFTLHLLRAPIPAGTRSGRPQAADAGQRAALTAATAGCAAVVMDDVNLAQDFPDHAFRDADHLRRPGWSALYARLLSGYLGRLATRPTQERSS